MSVPQKRRRPNAPAAAASPAPSDDQTNNPLSSRADLSSRPILTISRGPTFLGPEDTSYGLAFFKTDLIGVNRVGYRYVPAGINPPGHAAPCRTIESAPTNFRISWEDRSPFLRVTKDGLGILGAKGFRSARCNAPLREGKWYLEVKILCGGGERRLGDDQASRDGAHVRLGFGRREAPLNAPVGLDGYSYGYRDKTGDKVTLSRARPYGQPFKTGDVIGMYISLPPLRKADPKDKHDPAHLHRERIPIDLKGQEVFEILEYPQTKEMTTLMDFANKAPPAATVPAASKKPGKDANANAKTTASATKTKAAPPTAPLRPLPKLADSRIAFFVNGKCQGTAFKDIYDFLPLRQTEPFPKTKGGRRAREGVKEHRLNPFDDGSLGYYPFISLFNEAAVLVNPGPEFEFTPPDDVDALLETLEGGTSEKAEPEGPGLLLPPSASHPSLRPLHPPEPPSQAQQQLQGPTWRPAAERYPDYISEQWALDAQEEEETRHELDRLAQVEKVEVEKRKVKEAKKAEIAAKKKAKMDTTSPTPPSLPTGQRMMIGPGMPGDPSLFSAVITTPAPLPSSSSLTPPITNSTAAPYIHQPQPQSITQSRSQSQSHPSYLSQLGLGHPSHSLTLAGPGVAPSPLRQTSYLGAYESQSQDASRGASASGSASALSEKGRSEEPVSVSPNGQQQQRNTPSSTNGNLLQVPLPTRPMGLVGPGSATGAPSPAPSLRPESALGYTTTEEQDQEMEYDTDGVSINERSIRDGDFDLDLDLEGDKDGGTDGAPSDYGDVEGEGMDVDAELGRMIS